MALTQQFVILTRERALDGEQFFPKARVNALRLADELCFEVIDFIREAMDVAHDAVHALVVKPVDVCLGIHGLYL